MMEKLKWPIIQKLIRKTQQKWETHYKCFSKYLRDLEELRLLGPSNIYTHKNYPYYYYTSMSTEPHPIIPPQPHTKMTLYPYTRMKPHPICSCTYCTSTPIYVPYGVANHPRIPSLGYLHLKTPSIPPSYMSPNVLPTDLRPHS